MAFFHSFGGWTVVETDTVAEAARQAAATMTDTFHARARVVEVEIYFPVSGTYNYVIGYTFDERIPPHRKEVRDVDAKITVIHHLDIRQGKD